MKHRPGVIVHLGKKTNNKKETILEEHSTIGEADGKTEEQSEKKQFPVKHPPKAAVYRCFKGINNALSLNE